MKTCSIEGCQRQHHSHGMCRPHLKKLIKWGDANYQFYIPREEQWDFFIAALNSNETEKCIIWPYGKLGAGYASVKNMETGKVMGGNRLMCEMKYGKVDLPYQAAHNCGVHDCINPHHLRWATPKENAADKIGHGTNNDGERHGMSVLTNEQVREIRSALMGSKRGAQAAICRKYGVSPMTVSRLARGESYRTA